MTDTITPLREDSANARQALLTCAREGNTEQLGQLLHSYRNYLMILATTQLDGRLRRRVTASDLVQETMLGAVRDFQQFRGNTQNELVVWLRKILLNSLHHAYEKHVRAGCRDIRREVSLDEVSRKLDRSACYLAHAIADGGPSPSQPLRQREQAIAIADQLARLRGDYREVIVLRNLQGLPFEEVADRMDRKCGAVRMLWLRAIEKFRQLHEPGA